MSQSVTTADRVRQSSVTIAEILCIVGTLMGTGVIGTRVAESSGGALAADATHLAPAGPAFSIWSVIYAGLFAYTVWQWFPSQATAPRQRAVGWLVAASMLLNAVWLLVTQVDWIAVSVVVIVALLGVLVATILRLHRHPATSPIDRIITDGTLGLYLGWVTVAVCANVAAALGEAGWRPEGIVADVVALVVLVVVAIIGVGLARHFGRWAISLAMAWGLGWLAYGRVADEPVSMTIAVAAAVVAVIILIATLVAQRRTRGAQAV